MKTALLSVYNKEGIDRFALDLVRMGWDIISSGGTARFLRKEGIPARDVAEIVGPAILGHRVVTLSREVHAGLLAKDTPEDRAELERIKAPWIDLVHVDCYPLEEAIASGKTYDEVIEATDIGGPTILRSAAKGGRIVVSSASQRERVLKWLREGEPNSAAFRRTLAADAEFAVARYCLASGRYLAELDGAAVPHSQF